MQIRDIMTSPPITLSPDNSVLDAAKMIAERNIGSVPVCEEGRVMGIITDRDIVVRCVAGNIDMSTAKLGDYMTTRVVKLQPSDSTINASLVMAKQKIRRIPVVDEQKIVGMVSLGDLAVKSAFDAEISIALSDISKPGLKGN